MCFFIGHRNILKSISNATSWLVDYLNMLMRFPVALAPLQVRSREAREISSPGGSTRSWSPIARMHQERSNRTRKTGGSWLFFFLLSFIFLDTPLEKKKLFSSFLLMSLLLLKLSSALTRHLSLSSSYFGQLSFFCTGRLVNAMAKAR